MTGQPQGMIGQRTVGVADLRRLSAQLSGDLRFDSLHRSLYATDASVYRRLPTAVAIPSSISDLQQLVRFATKHSCGLIPRAAGTSLAGQCVGDGIVVDVSKHFCQILNFDGKSKTVTVEPGVVRDELNQYLKPHGLFFSPNTSTSNRCTIGGMLGNNSSGTTSIRYGCTRDKVIAVSSVLADGSEAVFTSLSEDELQAKRQLPSLEGNIYRTVFDELTPEEVRDRIVRQFPASSVHRRNTGYAIDDLINCRSLSGRGNEALNLSELLAGSEGTLALTTSITLQLDDLPPPARRMVVSHFHSIGDCLRCVEMAMTHQLYACEMLDRTILDLTKNNLNQLRNRALIEGDPAAILMMEVCGEDESQADMQANSLCEQLRSESRSYANIVLRDQQIDRAIDLRKAGLGLLGNMIGDEKAVACIEDTAVPLGSLADYIDEFTTLMNDADQTPVYYAHAGAGELHLRPILNLKRSSDVKKFVKISDAVAQLVKKYQGSMSGEHGDGIVRSKYIAEIVGSENFEIMRRIKNAFDPAGVFNPGKIIDPLPMDAALRYQPDRQEPEINTKLSFADAGGILRHAEKCNGSGDCLKSLTSGGVMCPSYRVTRQEKDSTRGRANVLREVLTKSTAANRFDNDHLREAFDLCVSCKACKSECPSSVDVAALKAEFDYQSQKANGVSLRTKLFAYHDQLNRWSRRTPRITKAILQGKLPSSLLKKWLGIAPQRSFPNLSRQSLRDWCRNNLASVQPQRPLRTVFLFVDEFINHLESEIGIDAIELLTSLGYQVEICKHSQSGRGYLSKGFLDQAKHCANTNLNLFDQHLNDQTCLVGIEPSAILTFRDEYLRLADDRTQAQRVAGRTFLVDEFLAAECRRGNIAKESFDQTKRQIWIHTHCHQRSLSDASATQEILQFPQNHQTRMIVAGCCGMAGSFGYEVEHYDISMAMAEQGLLPTVRKIAKDDLVVAPGISCRQQIYDATGRRAWHPVSILRRSLQR